MRRICVCFITFLCVIPLFAQPSGRQYRQWNIMNGNKVQTVFGNWGVIGQPQEQGSRGAWPVAVNGYIGDLSIFIGAEVRYDSVFRNGQWVKTPNSAFHSVVTCPVNRPTLLTDTDPRTGNYWTFEPENGYNNPNRQPTEVAMSNDKTSWPDTWPDKVQDAIDPGWAGSWNGVFGKGIYADLETYFVMDDNNDERFNNASNNASGIVFKPDSLNPARNGLGLQVGVRYVQYGHSLLSDVLFLVYDITNKSTTNYSKLVFGNLMGTYVGVTSTEDYMEYADDVSLLFRGDNLIVSQDIKENYNGNMSNPFWQGKAGKCAQTFIETPYTNNRIASYYCFMPVTNLKMGDDEALWQMLTPGSYVIPSIFKDTLNPQVGADCDYIFGSDYFSLNSGETKRFVTLLAYGYSENEILQKTLIAQNLWNTQFDFQKLHSTVRITNLSYHRMISGGYNIYYSTQLSGGTVDLYYSPDAGRTWNSLDKNLPNTGLYQWDVTKTPDCAFGMLRIYVRDANGKIYDYNDSPSSFTINNPANGAPTIQILCQGLTSDSILIQPSIDIPVIAGDPEGQMLTLQKYYCVTDKGPWTLFEAGTIASDTIPASVPVNLKDLPNSKTFRLKFSVSDGVTSSSDSTPVFQKITIRTTAPGKNIQHSTGLADTPYEIRIIDPSKTTGNNYRITFDDTSFSYKTFNVFNETTGKTVISKAQLVPFVESMQFDGLSLFTQDTATHLDKMRTHWNTSRLNLVNVRFQPTVIYDGISPSPICQGYALPADYIIAFFSSIIDTSIAIPFLYLDAQPIDFSIYNSSFKNHISMTGFFDTSYTPLFDLTELFIEPCPSKYGISWELTYQDQIPRAGDSLYLYTKKGFSYLDTIRISGNLVSVHNIENLHPSRFVLNQNFPNPFNPSTTIQYGLPSRSTVRLVIYNLLGQVVKELVNAEQQAGYQSVDWNATASSGIYFYKLNAVSTENPSIRFAETKKMLLLR